MGFGGSIKRFGKWQAAVKPWKRWTVFTLSTVYALSLVAVWLIARYQGEHWWIATLLLFGPRWVLAGPLILLIGLAFFLHWRSFWVLVPATLFALFPLFGLCVPWRTLTAPASNVPTIRVLTCNIHHAEASRDLVAKLVAETHPDIVTLQEFSPKFKKTIFPGDDWDVRVVGELCLATRFPIKHAPRFTEDHGALFKLELPGGDIDYYTVHLASPHYPLSDAVHGETGGPDEVEANSSKRLTEAQDLTRRAKASGDSVIISGDFNLPPDSPIYRSTVAAYADAFETAGFGFGWSYHTNRTMVRIDHILSGPDWVCRSCWLGPDVGSPHRPVIADLQRIK